jgi:hypothetical protein
MRTLHVTALALAAAAGFALPLAGSAEAAMGGVVPTTQLLPIEQAQFFFLGHNFCWYDDGWQGPGWYWCNYAWRSGYGWGGGDGWRGWNRDQWQHRRGDHGPIGHPPYHPPMNNDVRAPHYHAPANTVVHAPQSPGGGAPKGAGPGHPGAGGKPYPTSGNK